MKYNRIIMFCDYGLDDAIATLHILRHAHMFTHIDIVPIGGNVGVDIAYRNAHTLVKAADADRSKVRIVDARNIQQAAANIFDIHGCDGMGDMLEPSESDIAVIGFDEFKKELDRAGLPAKDCVLSLGPCTVPDMLGYVPFSTVLMGGTVEESPNCGDYEFNEAMDVPAFKRFAYKATAVATLDTCHDRKFGFEHYKTGDPLADGLIDKYVALCKSRNAPIAIYDLVAAFAVTNPERFDVQRVLRPDGVEFNLLLLEKK